MNTTPAQAETGLAEPDRHRRLKRIRRLAQLLDNAFAVPFTKFRFGWDSIIGLVPGGGDVATGVLATYIVIEAARLGIPRRTLWRMIANVALDMATGVVPIAGDLVDVAYKANRRNVKLLEEHVEGSVGDGATGRQRDRGTGGTDNGKSEG